MMSAAAVFHAVETQNLISVIYAALLTVTALFAVVRIFTVRIGCALLQIPTAVMATVGFFGAIAMFALGHVFVTRGGTQDYVNGILSPYGCQIITPPHFTGAMIIIASGLIYLLACCCYFGSRHLNNMKNCAQDHISRGASRLFANLCIVMFITVTSAIAAVLVLSDIDIASLMADRELVFLWLQILFCDFLLLFAGLSAQSFASKTYAFKVFENQMMKVETNADGTVYVPINEDSESDDQNLSGAASETRTAEIGFSSGKKLGKKRFIKDFAPSAEDCFSASACESTIL